jgi:chromosome segregation ATPase
MISCGDFPNVPLIGTRGCINYNPMLAIRQFGYPMVSKPQDEAVDGFILHDMGASDPGMLKRIIQSWEKVNKKGSELRKRGNAAPESYTQWVKERVKQIKLPFDIIPPSQPSLPEPTPISNEEVDRLKATIDRLEKENEGLELTLQKVSYERNELKFRLNEKTKQFDKSKEAFKAEKEKKESVSDCLAGATNKIEECKIQLNQAWKEIGDWKKLWDLTLKQHRETKEGLEIRISDLTSMLQESQALATRERDLREDAERILKRFPKDWKGLHEELRSLRESERRQRRRCEALENRNQQLEGQLHHLQDLANQDQATMQELHQEVTNWKTNFSNLAGFANKVV